VIAGVVERAQTAARIGDETLALALALDSDENVSQILAAKRLIGDIQS
jgi:hypothetical protein